MSANTIFLASLHPVAIGCSWMISAVWWTNSSSDRPDVRWAREVYATGSALGTLTSLAAGWYWG